MQVISLVLFGLSAFSSLATAAPAADAGLLVDRTGGKDKPMCCPKDRKSYCTPCPSKGKCPDAGDKYTKCSFNKQNGLVNLFICDVLNDITINIPVDVSVPIGNGNSAQ